MRWIHGKVVGHPVPEQVIRDVVATVRADGLDIDHYLASIRVDLGREGRRTLLTSAFAIATADGRVFDEEDELLLRIAQALEISPAEYRAALGQFRVARDLQPD
jgi:uncharacterized tellurite resistance protein B-like protein